MTRCRPVAAKKDLNEVNIVNFDLNNIKLELSAANSAMQASKIQEEMEQGWRLANEINRHSAQNTATLVAGAEASIAQKELLEQQLEFTQEQNRLLSENYDKLKEMYDAQIKANQEATHELKKSKRFNKWMMIIAIIAMLAAIASPIATLWVAR